MSQTPDNFGAGWSGDLNRSPPVKKRSKVVFFNPTEISNWTTLQGDEDQNIIGKNDLLRYEKLLENELIEPIDLSDGDDGALRDETSTVSDRSGKQKRIKAKAKRKQALKKKSDKKKPSNSSRPWLSVDDSDDDPAPVYGPDDDLDDDEYFRRLEEEKEREEAEEIMQKQRALKDRISARKAAKERRLTRRQQLDERAPQPMINISAVTSDAESLGDATTSSSYENPAVRLSALMEIDTLPVQEELSASPISSIMLDALPDERGNPFEDDVSDGATISKPTETGQSINCPLPTDEYTDAMLAIDPIQLLYLSPPLILPPSATDLVCPPDLLLDAISVYEILLRYGRLLRLSPFKLEDFLAALCANENSVLLSEIHIVLFKSLLREDDATGTFMYSVDSKDSVNISLYVLDQFNWPFLLSAYLSEVKTTESSARSAVANSGPINVSSSSGATVPAPPGVGGLDNILTAALFPSDLIPLDPAYPFVPVKSRLEVLRGLANLFLSTAPVREDVLRDGYVTHEDHCRYCQQSGDVLCCDGCTAVYHLNCLDPPLTTVPASSWLCPVCTKHQTMGVTDCFSDLELSGKVHRKEPIGVDRAGRTYWYVGRRIVVEPVDFSQIVPPVSGLLHEVREPGWTASYIKHLQDHDEFVSLPIHFSAHAAEVLDTSHIDGTTIRCHPSVSYANEPPVYYYSSMEQVIGLRSRLSSTWEPWLCQRFDELLPRLEYRLGVTRALNQKGLSEFCSIRADCKLVLPTSSALSTGMINVFSVFEYEAANPSQSRVEDAPSPTIGECAFDLWTRREAPTCPSGDLSDSDLRQSDDDATAVVLCDSSSWIIRNSDNLISRIPQSDKAEHQYLPRTLLTAKERADLSTFTYIPTHLHPTDNARLVAYRLSDEGSWRNWTNVYTTDAWTAFAGLSTTLHSLPGTDRAAIVNLALTRPQFVEEKERRRYIGNKFSTTDLALNFWHYMDPITVFYNSQKIRPKSCEDLVNSAWSLDPSVLLNTVRLTLCYFEARIPVCFYHPSWRCVRKSWLHKLTHSTEVSDFADALAKLELALRPLCFQRVWHSILGHLNFERTTSTQRDEDRRIRQSQATSNACSQSSSDIILTKTPTPVRHTIYKYRGEEYRRFAGGGWTWLSVNRRAPKNEADLLRRIHPTVRDLNHRHSQFKRESHLGIGWGTDPECLNNAPPLPCQSGWGFNTHLHPITDVPLSSNPERFVYVLPADELRRIHLQENVLSGDKVRESLEKIDENQEGGMVFKSEESSDLPERGGQESQPAEIKVEEDETFKGVPKMERPEEDETPVLNVSYCLRNRIHFPPALVRVVTEDDKSLLSRLPPSTSRRLSVTLDDLLSKRRAAATQACQDASSAHARISSIQTELQSLEEKRKALVERIELLRKEAQHMRSEKARAWENWKDARRKVRDRAWPTGYFKRSALGNGQPNRVLDVRDEPTPRQPHRSCRGGRGRSRRSREDSGSELHESCLSESYSVRRSSRPQRATRIDPDFVSDFNDADIDYHFPDSSDGQESVVGGSNGAGDRSTDEDENETTELYPPSRRAGAYSLPQYDGAGDSSNEESSGSTAHAITPAAVKILTSLGSTDGSSTAKLVLSPMQASGPRVVRVVQHSAGLKTDDAPHPQRYVFESPLAQTTGSYARPVTNIRWILPNTSLPPIRPSISVTTAPVSLSSAHTSLNIGAMRFVDGKLVHTSSCTTPTPPVNVTVKSLPSVVSAPGQNSLRLIVSSSINSKSQMSAEGICVNSTPLTSTTMTLSNPTILRRTMATVQSKTGKQISKEIKFFTVPQSIQTIAGQIAANTARQIVCGDESPTTSASDALSSVQSRRSMLKATDGRQHRPSLLEDRSINDSLRRGRQQQTGSATRPRSNQAAISQLNFPPELSEAVTEAEKALKNVVAKMMSIDSDISAVNTEICNIDQKLTELRNELSIQSELKSHGVPSTSASFSLNPRPILMAESLQLPINLPPENSYIWPPLHWPEDVKQKPSVGSLFRWHRKNLRSVILSAGRRELPGYDTERKRPAQVFWPYPSAKPALCETWRFRLHQLRLPSTIPFLDYGQNLSCLTVLLRTLWHCLRWDDILSDPPQGHFVWDKCGRPCLRELMDYEDAGSAKSGEPAYCTRKVIGVKPMDNTWQRLEYLVRLTHTRPVSCEKAGKSSTRRGRPRRGGRNAANSSSTSESPNHSPYRTPARYGRASLRPIHEDDPDYEPGQNRNDDWLQSGRGQSRRRGGRTTGRSKRSSLYDSDSEGDDRGDSPTRYEDVRVEEQWLSEENLRMWEIRSFMDEFLPPDCDYVAESKIAGSSALIRPIKLIDVEKLDDQKNRDQEPPGSPASFVSQSMPCSDDLLRDVGKPSTGITWDLDSGYRFSGDSRVQIAPPSPDSTFTMTTRRRAVVNPLVVDRSSILSTLEARSRVRSVNTAKAAQASVRSRKLKMEKIVMEQRVRLLRSQILARRRAHVALVKLDVCDAREDQLTKLSEELAPDDSIYSLDPLPSPKSKSSQKTAISSPSKPPFSSIPDDASSTGSAATDPLEMLSAHTKHINRRPFTTQRGLRGRRRGRGLTRQLLSSPTRSNVEESHSGASTPSTCPGLGDETLESILTVGPEIASHTFRGAGAKRMVRKRGTSTTMRKVDKEKSGNQKPVGRGNRGALHAEQTKRNIRIPLALIKPEPDDNQVQSAVYKCEEGRDEQQQLFCICKTPYNPSREYLGCDLCQDWFHFECVGLTPADTDTLGDSWHCPDCRQAATNANEMLYCICRTPYEPARFYIACDRCDEWYHAECVGMTAEEATNHTGTYICPHCCTKPSPPGGSPVKPVTQRTSSKLSVATENECEDVKPTIYETNLDDADGAELLEIVRGMKAHKMSWPLVQPPDPVKFPASSSMSGIKNLTTLLNELETGEHKTLGDFSFSMNRVFADARIIYPRGTPEFNCTDILEAHFIRKMRQFKSHT